MTPAVEAHEVLGSEEEQERAMAQEVLGTEEEQECALSAKLAKSKHSTRAAAKQTARKKQPEKQPEKPEGKMKEAKDTNYFSDVVLWIPICKHVRQERNLNLIREVSAKDPSLVVPDYISEPSSDAKCLPESN